MDVVRIYDGGEMTGSHHGRKDERGAHKTRKSLHAAGLKIDEEEGAAATAGRRRG